MTHPLYDSLKRKLITITLIVSLTPLIILGGIVYYQFEKMYREKIVEQIRYRAQSQAEVVDLFFRKRSALLGIMADTNNFLQMAEETYLSRVFRTMNFRQGNFVDLGVIDHAGIHQAYIGPYDLRGRNYGEQPWFNEAMSRGQYISDVYTGFRNLPHFIIAVRGQENYHPWILRATIDSDVFGSMVRSAQVGKTGDAYIVNRSGIYQTPPRFGGEILGRSPVSPDTFAGGTTTVWEQRNIYGKTVLYAGCWLKSLPWLLVVSQEVREEMESLFAAQYVEFAIMGFGILAIILTTVFTTRLTIRHLIANETRMNEMNAQLIQSDKLAALGKMAAGVAHEINNPLAVILQKTGWMEDLLSEEEFQNSKNLQEFQNAIKKIEAHVDRARKVVRNMLGYARKMEPHLEDVDINETINQTITLLENYARTNNIDIQTDLSEKLPIIAGDQAQLQQVFLNLISNAIDAIGKEGQVVVVSSCSASHIRVDVADNGPGIPESKLKRIFDPFFTTKEAGKGTGLGLWVSYSIMEKMDGTISVKSQVGQVATFTVEIPISLPEKK
ncbi:MAG TPA: sensor histidine kinase [Desulfatirhabdiaceae bacterium]|nr:sensor histidine kinase [Desulfatirhabdiaceae bacterium]